MDPHYQRIQQLALPDGTFSCHPNGQSGHIEVIAHPKAFGIKTENVALDAIGQKFDVTVQVRPTGNIILQGPFEGVEKVILHAREA